MIENQWYIGAFDKELAKKNPLAKKINGKDLVIFKTKAGKIGVLEDRCCHRNVQLSLGKVTEKSIQCAYHGWEYGCSGSCSNIPSLPKDRKIPTNVKVEQISFAQKHNAIWVWIGDESKKDEALIPDMPELDDHPFVYNYHDVKGSLKVIAESLIDAYHINHVHSNSIKGLMGKLKDEEVNFNLKVDDNSIHGEYQRSNEGSIWEKFYFGFEKKITTRFSFIFPHTSKLDILFKKRRLVIYEHFFQLDDNTVRMYQITAWKKIFNQFPLFFFANKFMLTKSNKIVREDIDFLESNLSTNPNEKYKDMLITPSDEVSVEFIKLWLKNTKNEEISEKENKKEAQEL